MAKTKTLHRCQACGATAPQWLGRCPECNEWGSLVEEITQPVRAGATKPASLSTEAERPVPITNIDPVGATALSTGVLELDRVLDGGLVPGSVTLVGGEPGMGKSTLVLQALGHMANQGMNCLLVSAEESKAQVRMRAGRLGALSDRLMLLSETSMPRILAHLETEQPDVLAIDSIQTVLDPDIPGVPGSVSQVRECAYAAVRVAKERDIAIMLVGHVTKEGTLAGPRVLEHIVDTVLSFEGDRHHSLRMVHALKHRFGSTQELGLFEMTETGLMDVADPSKLFLTDRRVGSSGSVIAPVLEGARPLLVEVQALVTDTAAPMPRRSVQGLDSGRMAMLLAVLERHGGVSTFGADVFASVAGGVRVPEAGVDLALVLAIASARMNQPIDDSVVALGEVGLGGEVRQVPQIERRLNEVARLGFTSVIAPASAPDYPKLRVHRVHDVREALQAVGLTESH